jgi:lysophospholipase L1-like esterase
LRLLSNGYRRARTGNYGLVPPSAPILLLFIVSLLLNAAALAVAWRLIRKRGGWVYLRSWLVARGLLRDEAKERLESAHAATRTELHELLSVGPEDVLFVGDSLTANAPWHELLNDPRCKNRGRGGDTSADVVARLPALLAGQPAKLFLLVGANDMLQGVPRDQVVENIRAMVGMVQGRSPRTQIYLQGTMPVDPGLLGEGDNAYLRALGQAVAALAAEYGATFIDLYPLVARDGRLDPAYTHDGLHLNGRGYLVWRDAIAPYVRG